MRFLIELSSDRPNEKEEAKHFRDVEESGRNKNVEKFINVSEEE